MIVDAFTHYSSRSYVAELARSENQKAREISSQSQSRSALYPNFVDLAARIQDLDKYNIDTQVTTLESNEDPNYFGFPEQKLLKMCRLANDECSEYQTKSGGRVYVTGTVPLTAGRELAIEEMRRAKNELGLKGFMVLSNVGGVPIDKFDYFWDEAANLGSVVEIHPVNAGNQSTRPYEYEYGLMHTFGWPYETTIMLTRLIFSGIMKKHPALKIVSHHMGGMIPFFSGRIGETYRQKPGAGTSGENALTESRMDKPIMEYFKMFYFDTAVGGLAAALACGYEVLGAERIVFSSDYPWGPDGGRGRLELYPKQIREICSPEDSEKILGKNMQKLLGI
jgi:predicted TIM-barrel fold metal-dependent hydrolase